MNDQLMYIANLYLQLSIGTFIFFELGHPKRGFFFISVLWTALFYTVHRVFIFFETSAVEEILQTTAKFLTFVFVLAFFNDSIKTKLRLSIYFTFVAIIAEPLTMLLTSLAFRLPTTVYYSQNDMNVVLISGKIIIVDIMLPLTTMLCMIVKRKEHDRVRMKGLWGIILFTLLHIVFIFVFFSVNRDDLTYRTVWCHLIFQLLLIIVIYLQYFNSEKAIDLINTEAKLENEAGEAESNKRYYELAQNKYEAITSLQEHLSEQLVRVEESLDAEGTDEVSSIIGGIRAKLNEIRAVNYCASQTVNSVLTIKLEDKAMKSIDTEIDLRDCDSVPFDEYELCSIIVNVFDNAVNSCKKLPDTAEKYIRLKSAAKNGYFIVRCENTCAEDAAAEKTDVREGHGYGLKILERLCEKYDGEFTLRYADGMAIATAAVSLTGQT